MKDKVLFVDDDPNILEAYQRRLRKALQVDIALGAKEGLVQVTTQGPYAVVIADMQMPSMNGIEFLARVKEIAPDTVRMMLTGHTDFETAMNAVNEGNVFRFLTKPCPPESLAKALVAAINQYRLVLAEREILENTLNGAIELLIEVLSWADPDAFGHALQMRGRVRALARELHLADLWELELATMFSQIGYIVIPHELLSRLHSGETLTDDECAVLARVPSVGHELLSRIPRLESVARVVLYQDKRYDGGGFPKDDVTGEEIPVGARILKVLRDFVGLSAGGLSPKEALGRMQADAGAYDVKVLDAAIAHYGGGAEKKEPEVPVTVGKTISSLKVGDVLISGVFTADGRLLIGPGQTVTDMLLVRLKVHAALVGLQEPIEVKRDWQ